MSMIFRNSALPVLIILTILLFLSGCSEREEPVVAPGSTLKADGALKEAMARLEAAGVSFCPYDPGDLLPEDLIPEPEDLADAEKQANLEEAIAQLNIVLAELEQQSGSDVLGSISDRMLVHLQLGLVYLFDAISRLLLSDDPEETFIIEFDLAEFSLEDEDEDEDEDKDKDKDKDEGEDEDNPWYTIGLAPDVQVELAAMEDPREYPLVFTVKERQAIIDAADLLDDAVVKPTESYIQPQHSSVDRQPYTGSAIWHLQEAVNIFGQYQPEDPDMIEFVEEIKEQFEKMRAVFQEKAEQWGFIYIPPVR